MYRHTFHLVNGEEVVGYSINKDLSHLTIGRETMFVTNDGAKNFSIPFFSVSHIETEKD